jgi:hypothetical protein
MEFTLVGDEVYITYKKAARITNEIITKLNVQELDLSYRKGRFYTRGFKSKNDEFVHFIPPVEPITISLTTEYPREVYKTRFIGGSSHNLVDWNLFVSSFPFLSQYPIHLVIEGNPKIPKSIDLYVERLSFLGDSVDSLDIFEVTKCRRVELFSFYPLVLTKPEITNTITHLKWNSTKTKQLKENFSSLVQLETPGHYGDFIKANVENHFPKIQTLKCYRVKYSSLRHFYEYGVRTIVVEHLFKECIPMMILNQHLYPDLHLYVGNKLFLGKQDTELAFLTDSSRRSN